MIKFECFPNDKDDKFKNITANIHEDTLSMIGKIWQVKGIITSYTASSHPKSFL